MERLRRLIVPSRISMVAQWASYKNLNASSTYLRPSTTAFTFCTRGNEHIRNEDTRLVSLRKELEMSNIILESYPLRGRNQRCVCPQCGRGAIKEKSLSVFINEEGNFAMWICFRSKCRWRGSTKKTCVLVHSSQLLDTPDPEKVASSSKKDEVEMKEYFGMRGMEIMEEQKTDENTQSMDNTFAVNNKMVANLKVQVADLQVRQNELESRVEDLRADKKILMHAVNSLTLITDGIMRKAVMEVVFGQSKLKKQNAGSSAQEGEDPKECSPNDVDWKKNLQIVKKNWDLIKSQK